MRVLLNLLKAWYFCGERPVAETAAGIMVIPTFLLFLSLQIHVYPLFLLYVSLRCLMVSGGESRLMRFPIFSCWIFMFGFMTNTLPLVFVFRNEYVVLSYWFLDPLPQISICRDAWGNLFGKFLTVHKEIIIFAKVCILHVFHDALFNINGQFRTFLYYHILCITRKQD
jgi:hypothetical protein